jgi:hypothetical protein
MTQATTIKFGKMIVKLGDGASPEVFAAPCGLTTQALNRGKTLNETNVPDCDDPDAPAWVGREVQSLTWGISGSGVLAFESIDEWEAFFDTTDAKNIEVTIIFPTQTRVYRGRAHLETFNISADFGQKVQAEISMQGDGELSNLIET